MYLCMLTNSCMLSNICTRQNTCSLHATKVLPLYMLLCMLSALPVPSFCSFIYFAHYCIPVINVISFHADISQCCAHAYTKAFSLWPPSNLSARGMHHAGLTSSQADEVETSLLAIPTVHMTAHCVIDGEESSEIMESDIVTCAARVLLTRHSHLTPGLLSSCHDMQADHAS